MLIEPRGNPKYIWIVGQNPGRHDVAAFTGPCRWIEKYVSGYFTNICWHTEFCHCSYFWKDWAYYGPKVMLIMGSVAWRRITGEAFKPGIKTIYNDCTCHCLYHPSGANMGNRKELICQLNDMRKCYLSMMPEPGSRCSSSHIG